MIGTGRIHVYYGDGKGKTTAAMGLVLRAAGSGLDVLMFQFLKDNSSSERVILEQIPNVTCLNYDYTFNYASSGLLIKCSRIVLYSEQSTIFYKAIIPRPDSTQD